MVSSKEQIILNALENYFVLMSEKKKLDIIFVSAGAHQRLLKMLNSPSYSGTNVTYDGRELRYKDVLLKVSK